MANLSKVVKLTQEQYNTLASGGTVGDYTGLDPTFLYLVEDIGDIIDVSNGVTAEIRDYVIAHPATLLRYGGYIYVAQYADGTLGSEAPTYYNCFEGDEGTFRYLTIDWDLLTVDSHQVDYNNLPNLTSITYSELGTKIFRGQLVPGRFYRITDFVTTTAQARTRSAGHQFDLIVQAISTNELSEDASACLHSGDTYFANSNLKAWIIKYSFANNADKYAWADTINGKGVIYYMKDEFFNECGYDFKNIQFARYKVTACANCTNLVGRYIGVIGGNTGNAILTNFMTIDTSDYKWFYTFDLCQTDYSLNAIGTTVTTPTGNITLNQIQCTKCFIAPNEDDTPKFYLNNFTLLLEASRDCMFVAKGFVKDSAMLGGASVLEIQSVGSSIFGGGKVALDGYGGQNSNIRDINGSLIYDENSGRAFVYARMGIITNCCLIASGSYVIYGSSTNYVSGCTIKAGNCVMAQSVIGCIANCNITCSGYAFYRSNIAVVFSCTGSGSTNYCMRCAGAQLYGISMYDSSLNAPFLSGVNFENFSTVTLTKALNCNCTNLTNGTFRELVGCSFVNSDGITCTQNMKGCNFGDNVSYLNISSTTTSQTITNTNFHDITGTDASNLKNVVIPEDYTNTHTVEIYSANQYRIYEIS